MNAPLYNLGPRLARILAVFLWAFPAGRGDAEPQPKHPAYQEASLLLAEGILQEAAYQLEQYLRDAPTDLNARMLAATTLFQAGRLQSAVEHAGYVLDADPSHAEARRLLVRIRSHFDRALNVADPDPELLLFYARLINRMGNVDRAAGAYARYLDLVPEAEILLEWARMYRWRERLLDAIPLYRAYLKAKPGDATVQHELGRVYNALGHHAEAARMLQMAQALRPTDPGIELDLARALFWSGEEEVGEHLLLDLLARHPDHAEAREQLAAYYHDRHRIQEAHTHYMEVLRLQPGHADALWRTATYRRERKLDVARLRQEIEEGPDQPALRRALIKLLMELNRPAEAIREADAFLLRHPEDGEMAALRDDAFRQQRAQIHQQLTRHREQLQKRRANAIENAGRWLAYHPAEHRARNQLATWYMRSGRYWEALREYERLLQAGVTCPIIHTARDRAQERHSEIP